MSGKPGTAHQFPSHPNGVAWWWQHHAVEGFFLTAGTEGLVRVEGKLNGAKYRDILNENLVQTQDLRLG